MRVMASTVLATTVRSYRMGTLRRAANWSVESTAPCQHARSAGGESKRTCHFLAGRLAERLCPLELSRVSLHFELEVCELSWRAQREKFGSYVLVASADWASVTFLSDGRGKAYFDLQKRNCFPSFLQNVIPLEGYAGLGARQIRAFSTGGGGD